MGLSQIRQMECPRVTVSRVLWCATSVLHDVVGALIIFLVSRRGLAGYFGQISWREDTSGSEPADHPYQRHGIWHRHRGELFSLVFRGFGGDEIIHEILSDLPGGTIGAVVVVMVILEFFLDFIEITFVVVPIGVPILLMMNLNSVWLGIMIVINL